MKLFYYLILLCGLLQSLPSFANSQDEIQHLLHYVAETQCHYERNGKMYNGSDAKKHIQRKFEYYHDEIKTAEDFVRLAATKSTISGKYYKIHCSKSQPILSKTWLLAELIIFRKTTVTYIN